MAKARPALRSSKNEVGPVFYWREQHTFISFNQESPMQVQTEKRAPMSENPFSAFIDLITLDQKIRTAHDQIIQFKNGMQAYTDQKNELIDRFEKFKEHVKELRKMVDAQELEMKVLDEQEKAKKERLDQSSNAKEYQSLKKEIDHLKHEQHDFEAKLMGIWNKLEVAQKELQEQQAGFDSKLEEIHTAISERQTNVDQLQKELDTLQKERPTKEVGVPEEWLEKYTHMRMQVADPVVSVMRGGCSACFYTITDQELLRLKRRALVQCKGCFRLLYMEEAMEEQPSTEPKDESAE